MSLDEPLSAYPVSFFNFEWESAARATDDTDRHPTYARTGYAARLLHTVLRTSGFREVTSYQGTNLILGLPSDSTRRQLRPFQRVSHYERTFSLGSKAGYHKLMRKFAKRVSPDQVWFYPESYLLPEEKGKLAAAFGEAPGSLWISKPGGGARGDGIVVLDKPPAKVNGQRVVQRYIPRPLLIGGLKFDLRFYVAVTSLDPLRIYLHENGLVRLATEPYNENIDRLSNRSAHLTNFSINKNNPAFVATDDLARDGTGNKWTHRPFWRFLKEATPFDPEEIRAKIEDAFVSVIISARETFLEQHNHRISFEVFGFDVMLDQEGKVSILEVNVTPAMGTSSKLDLFVKGPVVRDLYSIALIPHPSETVVRIEGILKDNTDNELIETITICEYEIGERRLGQFRCIYPTPDRVRTHGGLLVTRTPRDQTLERWVGMNAAEKTAELESRIPRLRAAVGVA